MPMMRALVNRLPTAESARQAEAEGKPWPSVTEYLDPIWVPEKALRDEILNAQSDSTALIVEAQRKADNKILEAETAAEAQIKDAKEQALALIFAAQGDKVASEYELNKLIPEVIPIPQKELDIREAKNSAGPLVVKKQAGSNFSHPILKYL